MEDQGQRRIPKYSGLLGFLAEAADIRRELGCSAEEAEEIRQRRAAERAAEAAESNVIQFDFRKIRPSFIKGSDDGLAG